MKIMRKKMFATLIVAVIAMFLSYNIYQSQNTVALSDLALDNVEALAGCEINGWAGSFEYRVFFMNNCWWDCYPGGGYQCPI